MTTALTFTITTVDRFYLIQFLFDKFLNSVRMREYLPDKTNVFMYSALCKPKFMFSHSKMS